MKRFVYREKRQECHSPSDGGVVSSAEQSQPAWPDGSQERSNKVSSCFLARWHSHQPGNQTSYLYSAGWSNLGGWESASVEMPQSTSPTIIIESARSVSDGTLARNLECKIAPMTPNRIRVVPRRRHDVDNRLSLMPS
jgi:hypothetical protein